MNIQMLYFAGTQDMIGRGAERLSLPDSTATVSDVLDVLSARAPEYARAFGNRSRLRFALDQEFVKTDALVHDGAELGVFPPVTGG
ncbi:MoaD/ThiS family protein [Pacificimonas flava]|uniref:Molybdopterin synthase sulfur carrier subunit n=1 Tax=Pacificimonas flava TaxID=1234595 RepID=M2U3T7_9SPHN|nr:MoaD/ThiS family protein [Pacificimonas flava]EMD82633.1 molybdopterin converting factor, subunit 1 [Pacificimonas flava]MBB5281458.1 molybdopterin synthase sulfur carrier subunit [Pacificimonas flava]